MKLSLITVCLNSEATISDTIESILSQDYPDLEYIIFDGGSDDQTIPIIKSFGESVRLIEGTDTGIFDAMNQGIQHASGEIIGILNSDDFYAHKLVISMVIKQFETTGADSVYGDLHYVNRDDTNLIHRIWKTGRFKASKFKYGWSIPHPTFFVRKTIYDKYGLFNTEFKISGDYELILRLLYKHRVTTSYLQETLVKMRTKGNSDGGIQKRFKALKEDRLSWKMNNLKTCFYTVPLKPFRKISQLVAARFA